MPADRRSTPGRRSVVLLVAASLVALVSGVALGHRLPPPDIRIDDARLRQDGQRLELVTHLGGAAKDGARFQIWFTLQDDDANDVTWRSDTVTGSYERDAHQRVVLEEQVQVPPGRYRVDVWVHQKRRSDYIHADHAVSSITITGPSVASIRPGPVGPITADLSDLVLSDETPVWLAGTMRVRNEDPASVGLDVSIGLLEDPDDGRNLLGGDVFWIRTIPVAVAGASVTEVPIDLVPAPEAGRYRPVAVTRRQGQVVDRVAAGASTEVAAATRAEHRATPKGPGPGTGPITITEVRPTGPTVAGRPLSVDVEVACTASTPQDVKVWWILDRLDRATGSKAKHLTEGVAQTLVLQPGERRTITVTGTPAVAAAGRRDLSAVVHVLDPDTRKRRPVDQAWTPGGVVISSP